MDLRDLALPGATFRLHVTPGARGSSIQRDEDGTLRIRVAEVAEDGKANRAVLKLLARALDVAPSRLTLLRGQTGRDKLVRLEP